MPKPERGSLSVLKRALPNFPPATSPKELEARLLTAETAAESKAGETAEGGTARQLDLSPAVQPDIQPSTVHPTDVAVDFGRSATATRLVPRPGRRKEPVQMVTYRIPASLYDRLSRVAEYNNLNMTDIVVEAIERHLPNFPQPPHD